MVSLFEYIYRAVQVGWIALSQLLGIGLDRLLKKDGVTGPDRLKIALERMGGSFLKFGQILSLQIDQLPREYCDALLDLLDRVPPFGKQDVQQVFQEELGLQPEVLYKEFDFHPFASASIGQVHRAVLKDSTVVAVKVQRPRVRQTFGRDAILLNKFIRFVFFFRIRTLYFLRDPVREFNLWIQEELDYKREATHATVLEKNARQTPSERIPRIHWDLTTSRILTMDFLEGATVVDYVRMRDRDEQEGLAKLDALNFDPAQFVSNVITNFMSDALKFGVFHADLHPANLLILRDNQVGYVDFGIIGTLSSEGRRKIIQLTLAYVGGKTEDIYRAFLDICELTDSVDLVGFRAELEQFVRQWYIEPAIGGVTRLRVSLNQAMTDLLTLCRGHGLLPKREMIRYIRSVVLADGLVSRLAPGLEYGTKLQRICEEYLAGEMRNRTFSSRAMLPLMVDMAGWMKSGPDSLLRTLETLERRHLPLKVRVVGPPSQRGRFGARSIWALVVWVATGIWLTLNLDSWLGELTSPPGLILAAFFGLWTLYLFVTLGRPSGKRKR